MTVTFDLDTFEPGQSVPPLPDVAWQAVYGAAILARVTGSSEFGTVDADGNAWRGTRHSEVDGDGVRRNTATFDVRPAPPADPHARARMEQAHHVVIEQHLRTIVTALGEIADHRDRYDLPRDLLGDRDPFDGLHRVEAMAGRFRRAADLLDQAYDHTLGEPTHLTSLPEQV